MLRLLGLLIAATAIGLVLAPRTVIPALTWVLAFLSLLMAADLLLHAARRWRRRDGRAGSSGR